MNRYVSSVLKFSFFAGVLNAQKTTVTDVDGFYSFLCSEC